MSSLTVEKKKSLFDEPNQTEVTKKEFVKILGQAITSGGELSWLTTATKSFEWADINSDVKKFLKNLERFKFEIADVGVFNPKTKKTKYSAYKIL